jgi:hypothetical protein
VYFTERSKTLSHVTFDDLRLGLQDLFENKAEIAAKTKAFSIYEPALKENLVSIESLTKSLRGTPLAEDLAAVDDDQDSYGRVLYYVGKAAEALKDLDPTTKQTVGTVTQGVIPSLSSLMASYLDEAARVDDKQKILDQYDEFLESFKFGTAHSLKDILSKHVSAAGQLKSLLSDRAQAVAENRLSRNREAIALRSATIGLLGRFRQALADEIAIIPDLPTDLETRVFAFFDQVESQREALAGKPAAPGATPSLLRRQYAESLSREPASEKRAHRPRR